MKGATLQELRALSRRSRIAQRWGFLAAIVALLLFPLQLLLATWIGATWAAVGALCVGGAAFLRYAHVAGKARGEFRLVFRRLADERKAQRSVPVDDATATQPPLVSVATEEK